MVCRWIVLALCLAVANAGFFDKLFSMNDEAEKTQPKEDKPKKDHPKKDKKSLEDCEDDKWHRHGNKEYMFYDYLRTAGDAEEVCRRCEADIASAHSSDELEFIRSLVTDDSPFWLGGADIDEEGVWQWLDGSNFDFTNWRKGEPDNVDSERKPNADCVYVMSNGQWRDHNCDSSRRFVCMRSTSAPVSPYQRTVIMLEKNTDHGDYIFFRGGIDHNRRKGCTYNADTSNCSIPIYVRYADLNISAAYNAWRAGDRHLDWYGKEEGQGVFGTWQPEGSPGLWTTNDTSDTLRYHPLNSFGPHYWMLDMDMDCSKTMDGLFEFKAYITNGDGWEWNINNNQCEGSTQTLNSYNHVAKCGALNVFHWNLGSCQYLKL